MSSNPLNPPSFRFPFRLPDDIDPETKKAIEFTYNGLTVHEQAFKALKSQINAAAAATQAAVAAAGGSTSAGVTSFNTLAGNVTYFPFLGHVNNQLGNPAYATGPSDNGAKIIVGDSSAVAVTLTSAVGQPWFTIIDNDSSADATLTPDAGLLHGPNVIPGGGFGIVFYDGSDFWCGATPKVTSAAGPNFVDSEIPSGLIDSANVTYTLAHTPTPGMSLSLYLNGLFQAHGHDYTLSSATITMTTAPTTGATLYASYRY